MTTKAQIVDRAWDALEAVLLQDAAAMNRSVRAIAREGEWGVYIALQSWALWMSRAMGIPEEVPRGGVAFFDIQDVVTGEIVNPEETGDPQQVWVIRFHIAWINQDAAQMEALFGVIREMEDTEGLSYIMRMLEMAANVVHSSVRGWDDD
jgi:hypothetical protein